MKKISILLLVVFSFLILPNNVYADKAPSGFRANSKDIAVVGEKFEYIICKITHK